MLSFFIDLNDIKESKDEKYWETVNLLIEYVRIVTAIHRGTFDMFHMDGYGVNGLDKIEVGFRKFEDFTDFMEEKWIRKLDNIVITKDELVKRYRKEGAPE